MFVPGIIAAGATSALLVGYFTTLYMGIATLSYSFLCGGLLLRKNRKMHIGFMNAGIVQDLLLVLTLEYQRSAINTAAQFSLTLLQQTHIIISTLAIAFYTPTLILGWQRYLNPNIKEYRKIWHIRCGITAFVLRTIGFFLMFSMLSVTSAKAAEFNWRATLAGQSMDDALSEAKIVSLRGDVRMRHKFKAPLLVHIEAGVFLETGSTQALFTDEFNPEQNLTFLEAKIIWKPFSIFGVQAGAINQSHHGSLLFINNIAFPAVMEFLEWEYSNWRLNINSQQAIATSTSFSTRAVGKESTPYLLTSALKVGFNDPNRFTFDARGTYFQFRNLTRGIAHDSRFYGNTVVGIGPEGAHFFHNYEGFEAGADVNYNLHKNWRVLAGSSYIYNQKGPGGGNVGTYYFGGFSYIQPDLQITPQFGFFNNESDSSVAYYTSRRFGHNNREGIVAGLEVKLPNDKISIDGQYIKANLINASPIQADRTYYELRVVTDYLSF